MCAELLLSDYRICGRAGNRVLLQAQHSGVSYSAVLSDLG